MVRHISFCLMLITSTIDKTLNDPIDNSVAVIQGHKYHLKQHISGFKNEWMLFLNGIFIDLQMNIKIDYSILTLIRCNINLSAIYNLRIFFFEKVKWVKQRRGLCGAGESPAFCHYSLVLKNMAFHHYCCNKTRQEYCWWLRNHYVEMLLG